MSACFTGIGSQIWSSIPYSIKMLKRSSFVKKIKELLVNFLLSGLTHYVSLRNRYLLLYLVSLLLFSPSIDKPCTCNLSLPPPATLISSKAICGWERNASSYIFNFNKNCCCC